MFRAGTVCTTVDPRLRYHKSPHYAAALRLTVRANYELENYGSAQKTYGMVRFWKSSEFMVRLPIS